jgi:hypothetical protein
MKINNKYWILVTFHFLLFYQSSFYFGGLYEIGDTIVSIISSFMATVVTGIVFKDKSIA